MKRVIVFFAFLMTVGSFAQEQISPKAEKIGDKIEVTYFYENGAVKQQGFFNQSGKLHGTWTSYDINGEKLAVGNYDNGRKVGKWFFWSDDTLKEVDFVDYKIATVNEWKSDSKLAIRN
ncbi:toxin-antitoxin system YwqK family antitoxin [Xanthomarina sp. GH4-25]|uniref:toxin-antitoxin system YwqK family antitoxin n=1 Tax=Xanthomarina sp. GH4-25 TaxID=3349335 RepID=UPI000D67A470|nr:nicotinic acid mononucleotide adenyltransferase [Flavobacteriaceae bacterium LYZ1037]